MKKLILIALLACLACPVSAQTRLGSLWNTKGPSGTVAGARAALTRAKKLHWKINYFKSSKAAKPFLEDFAYEAEGMQLSGCGGDFMKDTIIIVGTSKTHMEVVYPVWSKKNGAHVLRGVQVPRYGEWKK